VYLEIKQEESTLKEHLELERFEEFMKGAMNSQRAGIGSDSRIGRKVHY